MKARNQTAGLAFWVAAAANFAFCAYGQTVAAHPAKAAEFEVASVRENRSDEKAHSNFPLNAGPQFTPSQGVVSAHNMVLFQYIVFAYKPTSFQLQFMRAGLPEWARSAHFDIEARVPGNPTKDEMRAMMRKLLEERFGVKVHHESREVPVFALVLAKPGKPGPKLKPHPADDPECTKTPLPQSVAGSYAPACGAAATMPASAPGLTAIGGRKVTMGAFVVSLTNLANGVDRPVLDGTGLNGAYDFTLEWTPEGEGVAPAGPEDAGPGFFSALHEQLGLKLLPRKGMVDVMVLDRVERPTQN